jgi:hypothetical protein
MTGFEFGSLLINILLTLGTLGMAFYAFKSFRSQDENQKKNIEAQQALASYQRETFILQNKIDRETKIIDAAGDYISAVNSKFTLYDLLYRDGAYYRHYAWRYTHEARDEELVKLYSYYYDLTIQLRNDLLKADGDLTKFEDLLKIYLTENAAENQLFNEKISDIKAFLKEIAREVIPIISELTDCNPDDKELSRWRKSRSLALNQLLEEFSGILILMNNATDQVVRGVGGQ